MSSNLPYTCNTCLVAFHRSDAQRDHMRKDWHLYNMKRRIAALPPVSQETFNEKVLAAKATSTEAAAKASFEKTCHACQKTFYSENSYQNHVKSSKHKQREARLSKEGDDASVMSSAFSLGEPVGKSNADVSGVTDGLKAATIAEEEEEDDEEMQEEKVEFSSSRCLFCRTESADIDANVEHMYKNHGMFIPEREYLANLEGLINYLYRKITENHECLYCHAIRNNADGARTHMRDKGHCMIAFEAEEEQIEIGQYYDFRSTYSDDEEDEEDEDETMADAGGVKIKGSDGDEEGWETDSDFDDDVDSTRKAPLIYQDEYELHLPSGKSVGHRSLAKYYRQNLHNYPTAEERAERQLAIENGEIEEEPKPRGRNEKRALITRGNGGLGMIGASDEQKATALISERRERTRAQRGENRNLARLQRIGNSQKHFRDPLLQ